MLLGAFVALLAGSSDIGVSSADVRLAAATAGFCLAVLFAGLFIRVLNSRQGQADDRATGNPEATCTQAAHAAQVMQLVREKEAAEAANTAKSRYLANVSHEIRTPLNAIYGYAQLIERRAEIDPAEAARVIRRSAEHLTNLVEGLLDISLVENGVMRVNSDVVRLGAFIDQIVRMFHPAATAKGLQFRCELPERLPEFVRTDEKRLRQALINLLSNAIKFTDAGEVSLRVTYSGQVARFAVHDTGVGIPEQDRERIFTPFERVCSGDRSQAGFGLGLPITRALVNILGGDLSLESEEGMGSCFTLTVMLGHVAGYTDTSAPVRRVTGYEGPRRSILVVDDAAEQLAFMRQVLEELDFEVAVAPDGETALALSHHSSFDLVVLDVSMPGMSGWQTAERLRDSFGSTLRIVMLSANAHEAHGPGDGKPDAHDLFLVKPVEIGALVEAIGSQLGLAWVREGDGAASASAAKVAAVATLPESAREHINKLRELSRIGYVRGMEAEIREIEAAAPDARELVSRLYDCLDRFDLAGLAKTLESL